MKKSTYYLKMANLHFKSAFHGFSIGSIWGSALVVLMVNILVLLSLSQVTLFWAVLNFLMVTFNLAAMTYWSPLLIEAMEKESIVFKQYMQDKMTLLREEFETTQAEQYSEDAHERLAGALA